MAVECSEVERRVAGGVDLVDVCDAAEQLVQQGGLPELRRPVQGGLAHLYVLQRLRL